MIDKALMKEARKNRRLFVLSILFSLGSAGCILLETWCLAKIVNGMFMEASGKEALLPLFLITFLILLLRVVMDGCEDICSLRLSVAIRNSIRMRVVEKMGTLSPLQLDQLQKGKMLNLLYEGVDHLEVYFSSYLPQVYKAAFIPILFLAVVFPKDVLSTVIMLVTLPLIPLFMILIGKWTQRESVRQWVLLTRFAGFLQDILQGMLTLKSLGRSKQQGVKISEITQAYRKATFQVQKWAFISSLALELVATISIAMIAVGLGLRLCEGTLSFLIGFYILLLAPEYYQPLRTLGQYFHAGINAQEASRSIFEFLEDETWVATAGDYDDEEIHEIKFDHVSFRYPGGSDDAIEDVSFSVHQGESIAFIGDSGSGKTTLMMLALGFLTPTEGSIYVNKIPIEQWSRVAYQEKLSAVLQKPYIFQGTVLENIAFKTELTACEAQKAQKLADTTGLSHLLRTTSAGTGTVIGQGRQQLSGGQTALLLVSRALYRDSSVIFLDEMTDNLDLESERSLTEALDGLLYGRMAWIIAHRLQTLQKVDSIYALQKGRIVAHGTYAEIMKNEAVFTGKEVACE